MHVIGKEVSNGCFNLRVLQSGEEKSVQLRPLNEDNAEMIKIIESLTEVITIAKYRIWKVCSWLECTVCDQS